MEFKSDSGRQIPDSFKSGNDGWQDIEPPNYENLFSQNSVSSNKMSEEGINLEAEEKPNFDFNYNSLTGIAFGEFNSRLMDSYSQTQYNNALQGRGPLGSSFNAQRTAEQTLINQHEATSVASLAMSVGGLLGPEGLAAGLVVGAGIDYATAEGAFDATPAPVNTN